MSSSFFGGANVRVSFVEFLILWACFLDLEFLRCVKFRSFVCLVLEGSLRYNWCVDCLRNTNIKFMVGW